MRDLRDDQSRAITSLRDAVMQGKRRICMQACTGWGKTVLSASLTESARSRNKKVLFTVPALSLIDQTVSMFASQGIYDVGVIQADHHMSNWDMPVQIASVQTLMKRTLPIVDLVLIDECHKWFKKYEQWLGTKDHREGPWKDIPVIGLSATPWTKGLGSYYDHYFKASTIQEMIDAGHLSDFEVYAPSHPDLSNVKLTAGDYNEGQLSELMRQPELVADAVETWQKQASGLPTLCFCVDRAHAKAMQQKFLAAGIPCAYQDAFTKEADKRTKDGMLIEGRTTIKKKFHTGEIKVVCNVGTLTTGVDWDVRCISLNRPTKSDMLFVQIIGRGLRTATGKDKCLILDHSDNHSRLGFVTDIDESYTGLHDGKAPNHENRTEGIRLPKECPKCAFLKPPKMAKCPACGFVAQAQSKVQVEEGELRLLKRPEKKPKPMETMEQKQAFYSELRGYAQQRGYKSGWAYHKYKERFGVGPANEFKRVPALPPSEDTMRWIKHRQIAWAKARETGGAPWS